MQREALFSGFWSSGDFNTQNAYLCGCIKIVAIKRRYTTAGSSSRRSQSRVYYVQSTSGMSVRVCRKAFLHIHDVFGGRVDRALKLSVAANGSPQMDKRGRHEPGNKTPEEDICSVKEHITSFPQYESHYSRNDNPNRKFLSPDLKISKMYSMYKAKCVSDGNKTVSEWIFRKTFNENFNLTFGRYVLLPLFYIFFVHIYSILIPTYYLFFWYMCCVTGLEQTHARCVMR